MDVGLSMVAFAAAELEVLLKGLGPDCAALAALATLPLALRRRLPVVAFGCVAVLALTLVRALNAPWAENANALVFLVLLASYSVGAHAPLRHSLPALLAAVAWLVALDALWGDGEDYGFVLLLFGVPWLSGRGVRRYRRQADELRDIARRLEQERAVSERVAVARERHRIAHETHDAIAHAVGEMAMQASGAELVLEREPERARRALGAIQDTGREAVRELREVLGVLRSADDEVSPPFLDGASPPPAPASTQSSWPPFVDAGLALILLSLGVAYASSDAVFAGARWAAMLVQFAAATAIVLHQRRPRPALALSLAAYTGEGILVGGNPGSPATIAAVLLATYSAGADADRRAAIIAGLLALGVPIAVALVAARADAADVLPFAIIGVPWLSGRAVTAYHRQSEALRALTATLLRERDARARLAVLEERARVARELHDSVAHAISVMVLQAGAAEEVLDRTPDQARQAIRAVQAVGREALHELGTLVGVLSPSDGHPPLAPRLGLGNLHGLLAAVRQAGLPVRLRILGNPEPLPAAVDGAAYRVIQEALTNALKHSGAAPTTVTLHYAPDGVQLDILDRGTLPVSSAAAVGHGLAGMRERVSRHGGELHAGPASDASGFAVSAFLPLAAAPDDHSEQVHA
jgi:signal transduction histidine kinase